MIDLHTHVLPGIDDGPPDLAGSVAMLETAAGDGTRLMVATPHVHPGHPAVVPEEIAERVAEVNDAAERHGLHLSVVPGGEVDLATALELDDAQLRHVTIGGAGGALLVETPHGDLPPHFERLLAALRERGFDIVLAHPELNRELREDDRRVEALVESGVLLQVTARSLRRPRRSSSRRAALGWLGAGLVHAIASDAHASDWRPPLLASEVGAVRAGRPELARALEAATVAGPEAILAGRPHEPVGIEPRPRRGRLWPWTHARRGA